MLRTHSVSLLVTAAAAICFSPSFASAFGLKTHLWIGSRVLEDIKDDCQIDIRGRLYQIESDMCDAIKNNGGEFLSGSLGPDIYPDILTGQNAIHPGIENGWQTDGFLSHIMNSSKNANSLAFASGFLTHAAGDVFSHTYVNNYSGDIFSIIDEKTVERRHFVLEKYIDSLLPDNYFGADSLAVPADFLRDTLVHNQDAAKQYIFSPSTAHLAAMTKVYQTVTDAVTAVESVEKDASNFLADIAAQHIDLQTQIATGELALTAAEQSLRGHEQLLRAHQEALAVAQRNLNQAINAWENAQRAFSTATSLSAEADRAASAAQAALDEANQQVTRKEREIADLQRRIGQIPRYITENRCETIHENICESVCPGVFRPICRDVCRTVSKEVCNPVRVGNGAWEELNNRIASFQNELTNLRSRVTQKSNEFAAARARKDAAFAEKARREVELATIRTTKISAETALNTAQTAVNTEQRLVENAREEVARQRDNLAALRKRLIDTESIKKSLAELINDLDLLSFYLKNWIKGMDIAGREYVQTSFRISKGMLTGNSGLYTEYKKWLSCYGEVYLSEPFQVSIAPCVAESEYQKFQKKMDEFVDRITPEPIRKIQDKIYKIRDEIKVKIEKEVNDATIKLIAFVTDETTADFVDLAANPENATREKLTEVFTPEQEKSGKNLLSFNNVANLIDTDIGLQAGKLNPQQFKALDYALILAKLSLLQPKELKRILDEFTNGEVNNLSPMNIGEGKKYSILFDSIRSIDGNHQWQPYGLPYPRKSGHKPEPQDATKRHFGYGSRTESEKGFFLFINPALRNKVFLKLFPEPMIGEIGKIKEMQQEGNYPFPTCTRNPFPTTFNQDGIPKEEEILCP